MRVFMDCGNLVGLGSLLFLVSCLLLFYSRCDFCAYFSNDHFRYVELFGAENGSSWQGVESYAEIVEEEIESSPEPEIQDPELTTYDVLLNSLRAHSKPQLFAEDRMYVTAAKCDLDGNCSITGTKKHKYFDLASDVMKHTCFVGSKNGTKVQLRPSAKPIYTRAAHRHYKEKWVSYVTFLSFKSIVEEGIVPEQVIFDCDAAKPNMTYPIIFDDLVPYKNKTVLLLTQYYTHVDLGWIEIWLKHYLTIGVDLVVMYSSFETTSAEGKEYAKQLQELITKDFAANKVIRFHWPTLGKLTIHAHAQIAMINHGLQVFRGSVMLGADLDELLVPVRAKSIKTISDDLTRTHGTWQVHWNSHMVKLSPKVRESLQDSIAQNNEVRFHEMLPVSKRCDASPTSPHSCKAKWMFYHPRPTLSGVHSASFFDPRPPYNPWKKGKWMDENVAVMLHLRGIQRAHKSG